MSQKSGLETWKATVIEHMPHLSVPEAVVLALWSFGMVLTKSCGLTTVSSFIAMLLEQKENTVRQRLREWYRDSKDKKGENRRDFDVRTCFAPLVCWVISWWPSQEKRIAIAMDATTLSDVFTVLALSIVYRGCAIPVAWTVVEGNSKGSWKPYWLELLNDVKESIPGDWMVIVMADRGLYAKWLYEEIVSLHWHPFLRINSNGFYRKKGENRFFPLEFVAPRIESYWCGEVTCFKKNPLECTLLACWAEGHETAWLVVTDLLPEQGNVLWYGMRAWIERGFKYTKSGGWQWQYTRVTDPHRASRFFLAIAVATLWVVSVGGEAEEKLPASSFNNLPEIQIARRNSNRSKGSQARLVSCFRRGILVIITKLIAGESLPLGHYFPEPWPASTGNYG